jgi:hypothetical protein
VPDGVFGIHTRCCTSNTWWKAWTKRTTRGKPTDGTGKPLTVADAITFQKIDDYTYELLNKTMGEVIMTQKWVLSKDGRTRTVTSTRHQGNTMTTVYEKE